ncbi:MAG TPA: extracellular solute-binding protein [Roseiarcus sp.]|jgi:spermidine/putrescine-binding protein|nr:extracellular solute-binding protein [Roseiarcus sp.]
MLTALFVAVAAALGPVALDSPASPFAPAPQPVPKELRLLAPSGAFNAKLLREFERESGYAVAYDAYGDPARIPSLLKEPYDVVVLPGPALAHAIGARQLRPIEKGQVQNARRIAPSVAGKLASYDATGGYGLAWGWSATGLLYDAGKVPRLLGAAPSSWADALAPDVARRLAPCGVALPDSRDEMFIAAWRLMGVDPSRVRDRDVKAAADLIIRARAAVRQPASRDPISAIAGGAACLTFGGPAQAAIAARRSREGGQGSEILFAEPREGGPIAIDALAEPRDAPHPKEALTLIDFLLRPSVNAEATAAAGLSSAEAETLALNFRGLWPVGVYYPALVPVIEREWTRARAPLQPAHPPQAGAASNPAKSRRRR